MILTLSQIIMSSYDYILTKKYIISEEIVE